MTIRYVERLSAFGNPFPSFGWPQRWAKAGGKTYDGRMIALKTDPIWTRISRFGLPHPPFDYNSGMDVFSVSRRECLRLGVIDEDSPRQKPPHTDFNDGLKVSDPDGSIYGKLKRAFGDQVRRVNGEIVWRQEVLRETLLSDNFKIVLGEPLERGLISKLAAQAPLKAFAEALKGKPLTVDQTWRDAKRRDGTTHLAHFLPDPTRSDNIPMTVGDVELLPSVWREPDRVRKLRKDLFEAQLDTIDGHTIVAQIKMLDTKNGYMPQLWTLYKKIAGSGSKSGGRL